METKDRRRVSRTARPGSGCHSVPGLRAARLRRNVSQRQLASMAGVSYANISRLENGHNRAQGETVVKLAAALRCPWRELLKEPLEELPDMD